MATALILTTDGELARAVSAGLDGEADFSIEIATDLDAARACCEQSPLLTVFADFRNCGMLDGIECLLAEWQDQQKTGVDLVAIHDQYLPSDAAALIDLQAVRFLAYPFQEEEKKEVLEFVARGGRLNGSRRMPAMRAVETDGLRLVTHTPAMFGTIDQLLRVAAHEVTLLFIGETGTGKTTLARIVHRLSGRGDEPFQTVACGALPHDLIESELFGHVRGAFTGAERNKIGRFEAAGRGTLLLDEIDVLAPKDQAKLLRVIETSEFEPVGSHETRTSTARLIVASNVDLKELTEDEKFRSDLYYRLNVLQFNLLPLRERPLDIVPLAMQFVTESCLLHGITIHRVHRDFLSAVRGYSWPGNLRELRNQMQRSVLFSREGTLNREDLSETILSGPQVDRPTETRRMPTWSLAERVALNEQDILQEALQANDNSRTATAKALGISRVGLYKKMRKYNML